MQCGTPSPHQFISFHRFRFCSLTSSLHPRFSPFPDRSISAVPSSGTNGALPSPGRASRETLLDSITRGWINAPSPRVGGGAESVSAAGVA